MLSLVDALFEVAKLIGNPLRIDQGTANRTLLTKVRFCVEVNAFITPPISTVMEASGIFHFVNVVYDGYPQFCSHCFKFGHDLNAFYVEYPMLKSWGHGTFIN